MWEIAPDVPLVVPSQVRVTCLGSSKAKKKFLLGGGGWW